MAEVYEQLTGTVDGVNVTFTSSQIPEFGTLRVFDDMVEVTVSSYTETTITLLTAPAVGSQVFAVYRVKPAEATALDLISDALREIGVLGAEEDANIGDAQLAMRYLNRLIASNNICASSIYTSLMQTFALVANQASYTIGVDPAGVLVPDFAATRPTDIQNIVLQLQAGPPIIRDEPMVSLSDAEWASKQVTEIYAIPKQYHYDKSYPLGEIFFYPAPSSAYTIELWSWQQGGRVAELYDPISYPPGYDDFWLYQLALRLCGPFGRPVPQHLPEMERRAIDRIIASNVVPPRIGTDPALIHGGGGGRFNWASGYVTRS